MATDKIAILDAGAQYAKVIDRRVRELCVESEILPLSTSSDLLSSYKGIIISGGHESVYSSTAPTFDPQIFSLGIPILGICYGMQLMNVVMGGSVSKKERREDGPCEISLKESCLLAGLQDREQVLMSHGDSLNKIAPEFSVTGRSGDIIAAFESVDKKMFGVQFHPEVGLTTNGKIIFRNFLYNICDCTGNYTQTDRMQKAIDYLQRESKGRDVLVLVSGGVDSTVCAVLAAKALSTNRVRAIHIDTGFMRKDESKFVRTALGNAGIVLDVIDASNDFFRGSTIINGVKTDILSKVSLPEEKRIIIGDTFIRVAQKAIERFGDMYILQGTLRPDLIESASALVSKTATTIKTHHNDSPLVRKWRDAGAILEPLADYHKDEVRELGLQLGLPRELVMREPFPGPGLAVRIICSQTIDYAELVLIHQQLKRFRTPSLSLTVLPVRTVGVQGDGRTYGYVAAIFGHADWQTLFSLAQEIPKEVHKINRVVYVFGDYTFSSSFWNVTPTYLKPDVISQIQEADAIVREEMQDTSMSIFPIVLIPANFGVNGKRSIALRPFLTNDIMTGTPAIPGVDIPFSVLHSIVDKLLRLPEVSRVVYDLSTKPPGTIEWE